jgi:dipeptidyl aminopeptidase/acylaminoacyl peptidase
MRVLVLSLVLVTQAVPAPVLTPEQALGVRSISDLRISPDGTRVAFVVSEPPKGTDRNRDIWLVTIATKDVRRLTFTETPESSPRWSPDGRTLAFLSDRDGRNQIYLLSMDGGEASKLTDGKNGVRSFEWAPDGKTIALLATEPRTDAEEKKAQNKDDVRVVDRDDKRTRVWIVEVATRAVRQVTRDPWDISDLKWTPRGDRLVVIATDRPESEQETRKIYGVTPGTGTLALVASPRGPFGGVSIAPDGARFVYLGSRVDGPNPHDLYLQRIGETAARNLTGATLDRPIGAVAWLPDGGLVAIAQDGFHSHLYRAGADLALRQMADTDRANPVSLAAGTQGAVAFVGETATDPPEIYLRSDGKDEQLTRINARWDHPRAAKPEFFRYRSFDGLDIEAALLRPPAAPKDARLPLIVLVHGGPTGRWSDAFEAWGQLLAARGYAVLYPNIRGSVGYGHKFIEMNRADWGGADFKDVMAGVDYVVKTGAADPERLGIGGWSYGGYMAEWAITQTTRFKASVVGAGLSDLASEFGTENGPAYDEWFFGLPYEKLDGFIKSSPVTYVKNARTPTLILHGETDTTDPIGQGQQLYRALKRYGVPSDFVVYPREGHGLREEKHLVDRLNRIIEWFDRYVKTGEGPKSDVRSPKGDTL